MQFHANNYAGVGLLPVTIKSNVWNRTGGTVVLGDVVMTDTKATQSETSKTQTNPGADNFPLNNVITPDANGIGVVTADPGYWFGVVTSLGNVGTGADNTLIGVTWQGRVSVKITTGQASAEYGKALYVEASNGVTTTQVDIVRAVGRCEQDVTTTGAVAVALWDGISNTFLPTYLS